MNLKFRLVEGHPQPHEKVEKDIQRGIEYLEKNKDNPYDFAWSSSCGSTLIVIFRCHEHDGGGYEIIVTDAYHQAYHENKIFNN